MGRRKLELTEEQINERKKRWWGDEYNARRRARYAHDKEFAEQERARMRVRTQNPDEPVHDPRLYISELPNLATPHTVYNLTGEECGVLPCFTTEEVAEFLGKKKQAVYRWRASGKFPDGVLTIKGENGVTKQVYSVPQTEAILKVMGPHFVETPYYHESHARLRDKLFEAFKKAK